MEHPCLLPSPAPPVSLTSISPQVVLQSSSLLKKMLMLAALAHFLVWMTVEAAVPGDPEFEALLAQAMRRGIEDCPSKMRHVTTFTDRTFVRVSGIRLVNESEAFPVSGLRACHGKCDEDPSVCPAFAYYQRALMCALAEGYQELEGAKRILSTAAIIDHPEVQYWVADNDLDVEIPSCFKSADAFDSFLEQYVRPWLFSNSTLPPNMSPANHTTTASDTTASKTPTPVTSIDSTAESKGTTPMDSDTSTTSTTTSSPPASAPSTTQSEGAPTTTARGTTMVLNGTTTESNRPTPITPSDGPTTVANGTTTVTPSDGPTTVANGTTTVTPSATPLVSAKDSGSTTTSTMSSGATTSSTARPSSTVVSSTSTTAKADAPVAPTSTSTSMSSTETNATTRGVPSTSSSSTTTTSAEKTSTKTTTTSTTRSKSTTTPSTTTTTSARSTTTRDYPKHNCSLWSLDGPGHGWIVLKDGETFSKNNSGSENVTANPVEKTTAASFESEEPIDTTVKATITETTRKMTQDELNEWHLNQMNGGGRRKRQAEVGSDEIGDKLGWTSSSPTENTDTSQYAESSTDSYESTPGYENRDGYVGLMATCRLTITDSSGGTHTLTESGPINGSITVQKAECACGIPPPTEISLAATDTTVESTHLDTSEASSAVASADTTSAERTTRVTTESTTTTPENFYIAFVDTVFGSVGVPTSGYNGSPRMFHGNNVNVTVLPTCELTMDMIDLKSIAQIALGGSGKDSLHLINADHFLYRTYDINSTQYIGFTSATGSCELSRAHEAGPGW